MTNIPSAPGIEFMDNPHAPEVFADGATGWFLMNGNIRITFESARVNHITSPGPLNRVVVGRLVLPLERAEEMAKGLLQFIANMKAQTSAAPAQGTPTIQ
jgi:hypothetical protein